MNNSPLTIIAGPTGVGKSAIALAAAERTGAVIVSADSMQVYRGMEIGTAQPSAGERARVPHYLTGHVEPGDEYHVARFVDEANEIIDKEQQLGKPVIICGGTGLFLKHLIHGIFEGAPRNDTVRAQLQSELEQKGPEALRARLRAVDPVRETEINPNDTVRVLRALEVYEITGVPMSEHHVRDAINRRSRPVHYMVMNRPRESLYARIDARVDRMIEQGWIEEANKLMHSGVREDSQAGKALGYRELFAHLRGEASFDETIDMIKKQTRRFAKRQLTWFRAVPEARWIDIEGREEEAVEEVLRNLGP